MLRLVIYAGCLVMLNDVALARFINMPEAPKGMKIHNVVLPWDEANAKCQSEDTILASPINDLVYNKLHTLIYATKSKFYIGTKASRFGQFVSVEGVPLEKMTVGEWKELNQWNGDCLAMTADGLLVVPCETRLPFICYQPNIADKETILVNSGNICGPREEGYEYSNLTGSCYKLHTSVVQWNDALWQCASEGAYLAIIDDSKEAEFIKNMEGIISSWLFIGLRKHEQTGDWTTVHGQLVQYIYDVWQRGGRPTQTQLHCGSIKHTTGKLDDVRCESNNPFLCERAPSV